MATIRVDIADTPRLQELGLKYIKVMPEMTGMLFKFQNKNVLSFWMQDTYVPLDIAFLDDDGVVINVEKMIPLSTRAIRSNEPCRLALEVPAGTLESLGVSPGTALDIDWDTKEVFVDDINTIS